MTLCIGVQRKDWVDFYADSRVTSGAYPTDQGPKVFTAHGATWAFSGDVSIENYLKAVAVRPYNARTREPFDRWFIRRVLPPLKEMVDRYHSDAECDLLVAVRGELWETSSGMTLTRPSRGLACVGSGSLYAYGASETFRHARGSYEKVPFLCVCQIVGSLTETVGPPYVHYRVHRDGSTETVETVGALAKVV